MSARKDSLRERQAAMQDRQVPEVSEKTQRRYWKDLRGVCRDNTDYSKAIDVEPAIDRGRDTTDYSIPAGTNPTPEVVGYWNEVLRRKGLGMGAGSSNKLTYVGDNTVLERIEGEIAECTGRTHPRNGLN